MIHNPEISIIVPVYAAEAYLSRCLNSILAQSFIDFEILLINDGSPDNSGPICDEYARKDNRIHVFHKANEGVSSTRQYGIDRAKGKYSIHIDPDDWIAPNMLEMLHSTIIQEKADIVIADFLIEETNRVIYSTQQPHDLGNKQVLKDLITGYIHGSCCNKLIKHSCYRQYNISFPCGINFCEDLFVCIQLISNNIKIAYLPQAFYHYDQIQNSNSISRNLTLKLLQQKIEFINRLEALLPGKEFQREILISKLRVKQEAINCPELTNKGFNNLYPESDKYLFKIPSSIKNRILLSIALMGFKNISDKINAIITHIKNKSND